MANPMALRDKRASSAGDGERLSRLARPLPAIPEDCLEGITVLLVEDDATQLFAMQMVLEDFGCRVLAAEDGEQALVLLARSEGEPDLVVTDLRLRCGITGFQVIEAVRGACGWPLPAIVLTGETDPAQLHEGRCRGYAFLHKPVDFSAIAAAVVELVGQRSQ